MADSDNIWSVDRVAANALLAALKLEATAEMMATATEHFAKHRQCAHEWGAERAQSAAIRKLEAASLNYFDHKSPDWTDGFRAAEAQIMAIARDELLGTHVGKARSTGQILRALVGRAKQASGNLSA